MNSGRIFTELQSGKVNILPLFTKESEFTQAILFRLDHALFIPRGENNAQEIYGDEPIRLIETQRSLSEYYYYLFNVIYQIMVKRIKSRHLE